MTINRRPDEELLRRVEASAIRQGWRPVLRWLAGLAFIAGSGVLLLIAWLDLHGPSKALVTALPPPVAGPAPLIEPIPAASSLRSALGEPHAGAPPPDDSGPTIMAPAPPTAPEKQTIITPPPDLVAPASAPPFSAVPLSKEPPAWRRYAVAAPALDGRPRIAVIIDDLGIDRPRTARAIELPAPVTMSFIAYAGDLPHQTAAARHAGHELLVHVPMEPLNRRQDMGPNGLAVDLPQDEVLRRLRWDLDRFEGYVGINNHMGSRFTGDERSMEPVIGELKLRGLLFVDSRTVGNSTGMTLSRSLGVPYASRDVFLDDEQTSPQLDARLRDVEMIARKRGRVVAIGHPHDATLAALNAWFATLPRQGFVLVPISSMVKVPDAGD